MNSVWLPLQPINNAQQDHYCFWEDFFTDSEITSILARPEWCSAAQAAVIKTTEATVDAENRRTQVAWLFPAQETEHIWKKLHDVVSEVNRNYFHFDLTGFYEAAQLSIYSEYDNGHYTWHTDEPIKLASTPRKLSMSLLLSDPSEFEGGELQVKTTGDDPITLEAKKGRAWFFPSWTLHRVTPVTKGVRRSLVLWVGGPAFR